MPPRRGLPSTSASEIVRSEDDVCLDGRPGEINSSMAQPHLWVEGGSRTPRVASSGTLPTGRCRGRGVNWNYRLETG